MIGGLNRRPRTVPRSVAAALVVGVGLSLAACSSAADDAGRTTTAPLTVTASASVIAPSTTPDVQEVPVQSSADTSASQSVLAAQSSPEAGAVETAPGAQLDSSETQAPSTFAKYSLAIPESELPVEEASERREIEAQWVAFWQTYLHITDTDEAERPSVLDAVSVDPVKSDLLSAAGRADLRKQANYGVITHHLFWNTPIGESSQAVIGDCQDQSAAGAVDLVTGSKTVGSSQINYRGYLNRGNDGVWRVARAEDLADTGCPR